MSDMRYSTKSICPHCKCINQFMLKEGFSVVLCDVDYGGCDEFYVVKVDIQPIVNVYRMEEMKND